MEFAIAIVSLILIFFVVGKYQASKETREYANALIIIMQRMTESPKSFLEMKLFCEQQGYKYNIDNSIQNSKFIFVSFAIPFRMILEYDTNNNPKGSAFIHGASEKYVSFSLQKEITDGDMWFSIEPIPFYPVTREAIALGLFLKKKGVRDLNKQSMSRYR